MNWLTFKIKQAPGFRFNLTDLLFIIVIAIVSFAVYKINPAHHYYILPVYVGGSFFLFCNVFRIGNRLEAPWYLSFVVITVLLMDSPEAYWLVMPALCESLKWGLILYRVIKGPYVGVFYSRMPGGVRG